MNCFLKGVGGFVFCGLLAALLLPSIRAGGAYYPKKVPIKVRVIDTDEQAPVADATVTFIAARDRSIEDAQPLSDTPSGEGISSANTDENGYAEVTGTFRARDNRRGGGLWRQAWYFPSGEWLKVEASDRPTTHVWLNGHGFDAERQYENSEPLEVIAVLNKAK